MSYSNNPNLPLVRMQAVKLVRKGWSTPKVARHLGFSQSAIVKWIQRSKADPRAWVIPTRSSRPLNHPHELPNELVKTIVEYRRKYRRCAKVLHHLLLKDGHETSLSSVERTLRRYELTYHSKWKKWHQYPPRPEPKSPGILVEIDTIHDGAPERRLYVYTMLDVHSRWAFALPSERISTWNSLKFVEDAQIISPFKFQTLQSDHGPEFSKWFTKRIVERDMSHRHSRVRTPNDNAHLERFNRTIQDECLRRVPRSMKSWEKEIPEYLRYYNNERPHMALDMKSPVDIIKPIPSY